MALTIAVVTVVLTFVGLCIALMVMIYFALTTNRKKDEQQQEIIDQLQNQLRQQGAYGQGGGNPGAPEYQPQYPMAQMVDGYTPVRQ